ncbi:MAG: serine/threonine protein kinase [Polyangiaceae bacterium]|nr:serine/threonine protein kinase [Polyangiaceae bacterium]MCL4749018.1 serine/threonine protein kinase [Myxococcales bacterium]
MAEAATIIDLEGRRARASELRFDRGQRCGPYEIVRLVAAGGFGDVYEGVHHLLRRRVAIKILQNRHMNADELRARLEQEARVLSEIKNPHMVTVFDAGELDGRIWMAMELLEGKTLREHLMNGKPMPVSQALHHAACIANGAAAAHDLRVVHRDLKPENIFVTSDGHTVVLDLGTAKVLGDVKGRQTQRVIGTVAYMSPEHLLGGVDGLPIDQRTDVYSLCLILYEMLAGFHPFAHNRDTRQMPSSTELARMQIYSMPEPLPDVAPWVPDYVWRIVRTGIAKEREQRQATMRELEIELRQAARWFVEERAAGERSSQRHKALSLDADTQPDPIPAFVSEDAPRAAAAAPRLGTERLDSPRAPIHPAAIAETRTSPDLRLASPEPPAVTLGALAPKRPAIPRRVLLAPVAGALIGLVIVAGMNLMKRRASASAPAAALSAPVARAGELATRAVPEPTPAPEPTPTPTRAPAPAATTPSTPRPRAVAAKREGAPRPINDDDDDPSAVMPLATATPTPTPTKAKPTPKPTPKPSTKLPASGL